MNCEKTPNTPPMANNAMKLRILVLDDDLVNLAVTTSVLKVFNYEVITTKCPLEALTTLQKEHDTFETVLSDAHMPLINGFNFQRIIEKEFRIPVVLMSSKDKKEALVKSSDKNASFFLMENPPSPKDLKCMWEYVILRKRNWGIHVDIESYGVGAGVEPGTEMVRKEDPSIEIVPSQSIHQSNNNALIILSDSSEEQQQLIFSTGSSQEQQQFITLSDSSQEQQQFITLSDSSQDQQQQFITLSDDSEEQQQLLTLLSNDYEQQQSITTLLGPHEPQQLINTIFNPQMQPQPIITISDSQQQQQPIITISDSREQQQTITTLSNPQEQQNSTSNDSGGSNSSDSKKSSGNSRKSKMQWTPSLHNKFLEAVNVIGSNRAVPKKIMEYMNVPGLKRENIASHLQKYRIYERRRNDPTNPIVRGMNFNWNEKPFGLSNFSWKSTSHFPPHKTVSTYSKALNLSEQQKHLEEQAKELAQTASQLKQMSASQGVNMSNSSQSSSFVQSSSPPPPPKDNNNNISANNLVHSNSTQTMNNVDSTMLNYGQNNNNNSTQTSSPLVVSSPMQVMSPNHLVVSSPMQVMSPNNVVVSSPMQVMSPNNNCLSLGLGLNNNGLVNNVNNFASNPFMAPNNAHQPQFMNQYGSFLNGGMMGTNMGYLGLGLGLGQNYTGIGNFGNMPYNFNNNFLGNTNFATNGQLLNMSNMNNVANVNPMANNFIPDLNNGSPTMYPMAANQFNLNNVPNMFPPVNLSGMNNGFGMGQPVNNVFDTNNVSNMFSPVSMNMNMNNGYAFSPPTSMPMGMNQNVMPTIYPQANVPAGMNYNVVSPIAPSANLAGMNGNSGFAQPVTQSGSNNMSNSNNTGTINNISGGQFAVAAADNSNSPSPVNQPEAALDKDMPNFNFASAVPPTPQDWGLNNLDDFSMNLQEYAAMDDFSAMFPNVGAAN